MIAPGFEPGTVCLEGRCSIQLSYATNKNVKGQRGKPSWPFVGVAGFEPATSCSQSRRDNRATLHPEYFLKLELVSNRFAAVRYSTNYKLAK